MKKIIITFAILICWFTAISQKTDSLHKFPRIRIGVTMGIANTSLTISDKASVINSFNQSIITPQIGIVFSANMNKYITLSTGVTIGSRKSGFTQSIAIPDLNYYPSSEPIKFLENGGSNFSCIEIPFLICGKFIRKKSFSLGLETGFWFGTATKGQLTYETRTSWERAIYKRPDVVVKKDAGDFQVTSLGYTAGLTSEYKNIGFKVYWNQMQSVTDFNSFGGKTILNNSIMTTFQYYFSKKAKI